jgi:uncharacterized protein
VIIIGSLIDSHVHLFPEKMMKAVYSYFSKHYGWDLPFPTEPDQLLSQVVDAGAESCFALAYTHKPGLSRSLNGWLNNFCRQNRNVIPFGAAHPADQDFATVVTECLDTFNFPGIKLHCLVQHCRPDDSRLFPLYEAIVDRSRAVVIHAGSFPQPAAEHLGIGYIANLLNLFPTLKVIIPHLGLNDLLAYRKLLATYDGLYLDTAFVFQNALIKTPLTDIVTVIKEYPRRILYGSDFPFILEPPQNGIARIKDLNLPVEILRLIFYENARRLLEELNY